MEFAKKKIVVLGSTGSIGKNALKIVAAHPEQFQVVGLSAHRQASLLAEQATACQPQWAVLTDDGLDADSVRSQFDSLSNGVLRPAAELETLVQDPSVDVVLSAIVGVAGLHSNWAALGAGKTLALANKETLVAGGGLVMDRARQFGARILPVDSEHNAIFQAAQAGRRSEIERVILTASGGPFRNHSIEQLKSVTLQETLNHPTWNMGRKITVDSATMMNKALEIIEARWLFDLPADQIRVMIHPESVIHSLVEFTDGSVLAQLSPPDMKLPIQHALTYPDRLQSPAAKMDWDQVHQLNLAPPDLERFPALQLGFEVADQGGTCGAVLNAANESAVQAFLENKIGFLDIVRACRDVLDNHNFVQDPEFDQIIEADRWAREEIDKWMST